ncbi:MAG: hypothetical protein PHX80_04705 [Candidatus Nanoarchaeia archaeon]|nr:hypothetical protein [Candidatus Nanoarchaeia archaeon]
MKSASTIYRQSGSDLGFKQWLENEKMSHELNLGKGKTKRGFDEWLEIKYAKKAIKNASGNIDAAKNILKKTAEKIDDKSQPIEEAPVTEKTILGMKPIIFYTVATGLALITTVVIVKIVKK